MCGTACNGSNESSALLLKFELLPHPGRRQVTRCVVSGVRVECVVVST